MNPQFVSPLESASASPPRWTLTVAIGLAVWVIGGLFAPAFSAPALAEPVPALAGFASAR